MADNPVFCTHCGAKQLTSGARFCHQCGQPLVPPQPVAPVAAPAAAPPPAASAAAGVAAPARRGLRWPILLVLLAAVVVIAFAAWALAGDLQIGRPSKEVILERSVKAMAAAKSYHFTTQTQTTQDGQTQVASQTGDYESPDKTQWTFTTDDKTTYDGAAAGSGLYIRRAGEAWEPRPNYSFTDTLASGIQTDAERLGKTYRDLVQLDDETIDRTPCYHLRFSVDVAKYLRLLGSSSDDDTVLESIDVDLWVHKRDYTWVQYQWREMWKSGNTHIISNSELHLSDYGKRFGIDAQIEAASEATLKSLYDAGMDAFNKKSWGPAIRALRQVVATDPKYRDAAQKLEEAAANTDTLPPIKALYDKATRWDTDPFDQAAQLGFTGGYYPNLSSIQYTVRRRDSTSAEVEARGHAFHVPASQTSEEQEFARVFYLSLGDDGTWTVVRHEPLAK